MSKVSNNSENTNYNHVSVKTDSMVKMIKELSKLGVFKGKTKPRAKRGSGNDMGGDDMGGPGPQMRNLPPIQQIPQGATTQQIQDIQQRNAAALAQLRSEVQQGRIADIQGTRFRSQQEAGVYTPFERTRSVGVMVPDISEEGFTQTINEGGPEAVSQLQETTFPVEETENIPIARLQPLERIAVGEPLGEAVGVEAVKTGGGSGRPSLSLRKSVTDYFGLPPIPSVRGTDTVDVLIYYRQFMDTVGGRVDESIVTSKERMIKEMNNLADTLVQKI